jgi:hypothetical protein
LMVDPVTGERKPVLFSKAGTTKEVPGGFKLPPVISSINGVAVDLQGQKSGAVLPQAPTDLVILGPDGKPQINPLALSAKTQVAAAGAPRVSVETKVNTANLADAATKQLESSLAGAKGGITTLQAVDRMQKALDSGMASTGPFSSLKNFFDRTLGTNKEGVKQRRVIEQGLNELTLAARKYLQGQGAVSDFEAKSIEKAAGGNVDELASQEIQAVIEVAKRSAETSINNHNDMLDNAAGMEGSGQYLPMFQLPEGYRRTTYESPVKTNAKPVAVSAKKPGLPPKGASSTPSTYRSRFPKPGGE